MLTGRRGRPIAWALWGGFATLGLLWVWGYAMDWDRLLAIMGPNGHTLLLPY